MVPILNRLSATGGEVASRRSMPGLRSSPPAGGRTCPESPSCSNHGFGRRSGEAGDLYNGKRRVRWPESRGSGGWPASPLSHRSTPSTIFATAWRPGGRQPSPQFSPSVCIVFTTLKTSCRAVAVCGALLSWRLANHRERPFPRLTRNFGTPDMMSYN